MLIIARTDARQSYELDEVYRRLRVAAELDADIIFLEVLQSMKNCRRICSMAVGDGPNTLEFRALGL